MLLLKLIFFHLTVNAAFKNIYFNILNRTTILDNHIIPSYMLVGVLPILNRLKCLLSRNFKWAIIFLNTFSIIQNYSVLFIYFLLQTQMLIVTLILLPQITFSVIESIESKNHTFKKLNTKFENQILKNRLHIKKTNYFNYNFKGFNNYK